MAIRIIRTAQATWSGTVPEGGGRLALGMDVREDPAEVRVAALALAEQRDV